MRTKLRKVRKILAFPKDSIIDNIPPSNKAIVKQKISSQNLEDMNRTFQNSEKYKKQSNSWSSSNLSIQDNKIFDEDNNLKLRRASIDKRRKPVTKRRKYIDLYEEYLELRYILFYADDVVQDALTAKKLVQNQYMIGDPAQNNKLCEQFKKELRENQGIYFDINISPRKKNNSFMLLPFSNLEGYQETSEGRFEKDVAFSGSFDLKTEEYISPTFKVS